MALGDDLEAVAYTRSICYTALPHPKILRRVIGSNGSHSEICSAALLMGIAEPGAFLGWGQTDAFSWSIVDDHTRREVKVAGTPR